jgi:hypothetical protein
VLDIRHASAKITFVNVIKCPFRLSDAIECAVCIGRYLAARRAAQVPVGYAANLRCGGRRDVLSMTYDGRATPQLTD